MMGATLRRPLRYLVSVWPWRALGYVFLSALLGIGMAPFVLVFLLTVPLQAIAIGKLERQRVRLIGYPALDSPHAPHQDMRSRTWLVTRLREPGTWREVAYLLLAIVLGVLAFLLLVIAATAVSTPVGILVTASAGPGGTINPFGNLVIPAGRWAFVIAVVLAVLMLAASLYAAGLLAATQALVVRVLIGAHQEELERRVVRLADSRLSLVDSFEGERHRIERELHDGVQQRLVALTMHLGVAELELSLAPSPPSAALEALATARAQAEHALADLRRAVRGIHPQVLADHGVAAAIGELASNSGLSVDTELVAGRLPAPFEAAAYFTASESLGNAARHAGATRVVIRTERPAGGFRLVVEDDGRGGADPSAGTGIAGLAQRAEALGGTLGLESPDGGPTRVVLTFPRDLLADGS